MESVRRSIQSGIALFTLVSFLVMGGMVLTPAPAVAHPGHAGSKITFVEKKEALKQMLPTGAKIIKRKESLSKSKAGWAKDSLGVALNRKVYTYYLARDKSSGRSMGAAITAKVDYRHGEVTLALGVDADGRITEAAVLSVHAKYIPDLESSIGMGFLDDLQGKSIEAIASAADQASDDGVAKVVFTRLHQMVALLLTFQHVE